MNETFHFCLYVAGEAPNSVRALANLETLCRERWPECHRIEVIDVLRDPERALNHGILLTPTLVRVAPEPEKKIVGSLNEKGIVLQSLGLGN